MVAEAMGTRSSRCPPPVQPWTAIADLWATLCLPPEALDFVTLSGQDPVFPSSFAVGTAAQTTQAAAALAACEFAHVRGSARQRVSVALDHAAAEATGWFSIDGRQPDLWDAFAGLYRCADGAVRLHTNFRHHRVGALRLLGLDPAAATRADVEHALLGCKALDFEQAAADAGLVVAALRSFAQWDATPQGRAVAEQPPVSLQRIGDAAPLSLPPFGNQSLPLEGVRVLDLTRILAGPVCGRTLACLGADVMLLNAPHLPNIEAIADTSRGKLSAHLDLQTAGGQNAMWDLVAGAQVFSQSYRPGALAAMGFSPTALAAHRPGIVVVSLSAYGTHGPWAGRRGFDSLVQTAMGFNDAEGEALAAAADHGIGTGEPRALPMQILDFASGWLMAFGAAAALWRQQQEGGSWLVQVSLAQTGQRLRGLGRIDSGFATVAPGLESWLELETSGFGMLRAVRPAFRLERTAARTWRSSSRPGADPPRWPAHQTPTIDS